MIQEEIEQLAREEWVKIHTQWGSEANCVGKGWDYWVSAFEVVFSKYKWQDQDMKNAHRESWCRDTNHWNESSEDWLKDYELRSKETTRVSKGE